jgi:DNA-binding CsgD family transcriptional regulator
MDKKRRKGSTQKPPQDVPHITATTVPSRSDRTKRSAPFLKLDRHAQLVAVIGGARWAGMIRFLDLSPRERQIIECILSSVEGDALIGERLGMRSRTVHTHLERMYRKLRVTSRSQLVARLFVSYATYTDTGAAGGGR